MAAGSRIAAGDCDTTGEAAFSPGVGMITGCGGEGIGVDSVMGGDEGIGDCSCDGNAVFQFAKKPTMAARRPAKARPHTIIGWPFIFAIKSDITGGQSRVQSVSHHDSHV